MSTIQQPSPLVQGAPIFGPCGKFYKFLRATPLHTQHAWSINPVVWGQVCHYWDGHTHPCLKEHGDCPLCFTVSKPRWYGYLPCVEATNGKIWLAEIPKGAAENCPTLTSKVSSLRGMYFSLARRGRGNRAPVVLEFEDRKFPHRLPPPIDTRAALERTWGCSISSPAGLSADGLRGEGQK